MTQSDAASRLIGPGLSRFLQQRPSAPPGSVCDMCAEQVTEDHPHVVNLDGRRLMCTCRGCYLLFSAGGSGGGKYRQVPNTYSHDPEFTLTPAQWDGLQIPVSMAFFFHNSALGEVVALYPSPAGATESTLPLDAWADIVKTNPRLAAALPDVEAVLVRKASAGFECFLVPIDVCYELVGRVRKLWKGFDGGQEMWSDLDKFFEEIGRRAVKGRR